MQNDFADRSSSLYACMQKLQYCLIYTFVVLDLYF